MIKLFNTLSRQKEIFKPLRDKEVGLYTCGPTVYDYAHIGNLRTFLFEDILRRSLEYFGYKVKHVMNITDVGHLTSDADEGEDKLEKGAQREGKTVWQVAKFYTKSFLADSKKLNLKKAHKLIRATDTIQKQIDIIQKLSEKGYAYETSQAVYFDISKFSTYTKLSRQKLEEQVSGAREEVVKDPEKRNPQDFALWFKRVGRFKNHVMHWSSPWGDGFPGWHIECSAISSSELDQPFDIHTGGIDHIYPHHTNEIAQSEAAYEKPLANYWLHGEFLLVNGGKMSKSKGNFFTLRDIENKGFDLLAFRYLTLTTHYRSKLNFTWESLRAAENTLERFRNFISQLLTIGHLASDRVLSGQSRLKLKEYKKEFKEAVADDLNMPEAVAVVWKLINDYNREPEKYNPKKGLKLIYSFDKVLGLNLKKIGREKIPAEIKNLVEQREKLRNEKKWKEADEIREEIEKLGWKVKDTAEGTKITKN